MTNFPAPVTAAPEWLGEDPAGKRIAVIAEQGWGDQLMFGRHLALLRQRAGSVFVVCHPKLARFFERLGYWTRPFYLDQPIPPCDAWVRFGAIHERLGLSEPAPARYFPLGGAGGGVGVIPNGNPAHRNDANRSLFGFDAVRLLALGRDLRPEATGCYDFSDTADLIADLDLIITVDTAMAHLAGATGKPCWVLLPRDGLDPRWGDGLRSPWYPDFRLYRQPCAGDWSSVLDAVSRDLAP